MLLWTFVGLGALAAIIVRVWGSTLRHVGHDDRGFVSQQWLAEHRHAESHAESR